MCGLVGIAGKLRYADELFMKRLLLLDYFRGKDSTGLAAIRKNGSTELAKAAVNPITFFDMKSFDKALNGISSQAFIGHNRAATLGKVNDANAHPYQYGEITGAHNGTLDKKSWERLEFEAGVPTDTDSAAVFACINEIGIDDTIPLMEHGDYPSAGAWALTYFNKTNGNMCFIKNEHRPLWYAFNEDRTKMYWASEWAFLDAAAKMTKETDWDGWYVDEDGFSFFPFDNDHLYEVNLDELSDGLSKNDIKKLKGRKLEGREPIPFVPKKPTPVKNTSNGGSGPWKKQGKGGTTTSNTSANNNDLDDDISDFIGKRNFQVNTEDRWADDPLNGLISETRFNYLTQHGCSYCGSDIDINDTGYTIYDNEDAILCSDCSKHDNDNIKLYLPPAN